MQTGHVRSHLSLISKIGEHVFYPIPRLSGTHPGKNRKPRERIEHSPLRWQREPLWQVGDSLSLNEAPRLDPVDPHTSALRFRVSEHERDQRRLAGAGGA